MRNLLLASNALPALAIAVTMTLPTAIAENITDQSPVADYNESSRPQFHFTAHKNWINDPNGLVFFQGDYHQFFQYNPIGLDGGALKAWGHSVSPDLVHWREVDVALMPDRLGSIWSGSAVVDLQNTTGFRSERNCPNPRARHSHSPSPTAMIEVGRGQNTPGILFSNILRVGIAIRRSCGMDRANNRLWLSIWTAIDLHSWSRAI
jgi:hypothetical protein